MKKRIHFQVIAASVLFVSAATLNAATVSSAGTLTDLTPGGFGIGTDIADLDAQGVGVDGFVLFNSIPEGGNSTGAPWNQSIVNNSPAYITALDGSASSSSGGWANYDDARIGGTTYNTGGIAQAGGTDGVTPYALFTFDLTGTVPPVVTIGLLTDNSDSVIWTPANIRIEGPGAINADQNVIANGGSDLVQFNINGGVAGETYTIWAIDSNANGGGALIGGITFDSIPEPGSLSLLAAGGLMLLRRRVRRSAT